MPPVGKRMPYPDSSPTVLDVAAPVSVGPGQVLECRWSFCEEGKVSRRSALLAVAARSLFDWSVRSEHLGDVWHVRFLAADNLRWPVGVGTAVTCAPFTDPNVRGYRIRLPPRVATPNRATVMEISGNMTHKFIKRLSRQ